METITVGEFKARMSEIMTKADETGEKVAIVYGKNKVLKGYYTPHNPKKLKKRKLGIWEGKGTFKWQGDGKITVEEFLGEE